MDYLKKIKNISIHRGGGLILSMDYSTLECRIFAAICKDQKLINVLNSGEDLHCQTARAIFPELKGMSNKEIKEHYNGLRSKAKSCLTDDTKILLTDGSEKTIKELLNHNNYEKCRIISRDEISGYVISSNIIRIEETNRVTKLIKFNFNNGNVLKCTPDHKIRLKSGEYKQAEDILLTDSVDNISCSQLLSITEINLDDPIPVYDIEVSNISNSHNFCADGVFVHNCMFGLLYGKSTYNFAQEWGCSVEDAQNVIDGLMGAYPGIKEYVNAQHEFAKKNGYITNVFGQKRPLPGAQLPEFGPTKKQFRHAMNAAQNCFVGDTRIELLDGTTMSFKDVVDIYNKKDLYVYSVEKNGHIIPGKIIAAAQTKIVNELAKVTLDNGEVIKCTVDHKFIMRNGERKEARLLKPGDSVMPLYKGVNSDGYVVYKDNLDNKQKRVYDMTNEYYKEDIFSSYSVDNDESRIISKGEWKGKIVSIEIINCKPTPVYNIEIENKENTHNYALSAGVFVCNSPIQCFLGETKIDLLDGTKIEIKNLVGNTDGKYVYSCKEDGTVITGKIVNTFESGKATDLLKITLDNNEYVICTKEHQFMLKSGNYVHAIDLKIDDSLMSLHPEKLNREEPHGQFYNHKVVSIEHIHYDQPVSVYDIEIENKDNTHNFALSAGVFVHNSSASIMAWISGTHVQEEFLLQGMKSIMIGGVHDSTYVDVYPGELIKAMKVFNFHEQIIPNKIHDWLNGVNLMADFGLGQSWGRELDVKSWELKDNRCILKIKGGNVNWNYLKRELDEAYDYEILSIEDGDDIPPEEREDLPIELSDKYQTITLSFVDDCPDIEFKSKYYVGNHYFGERIDLRENLIGKV